MQFICCKKYLQFNEFILKQSYLKNKIINNNSSFKQIKQKISDKKKIYQLTKTKLTILSKAKENQEYYKDFMSKQKEFIKIQSGNINKTEEVFSFQKNQDKQINDGIEDEIFLRNDVNQLFDNMMINSNFNLKKYNKTKHHKKDNNKQLQQGIRQNNTSLINSLRQKNLTEPIYQINFDIVQNNSKKKNSRIQIQNHQKKLHTTSILNTNNLDKLLRKNQYKTSYNQSFSNKNNTTELNKTIFKPQNKNNNQKNQISNQISQKIKLNVRKKIMSFSHNKNQSRYKNDSFSVDIKKNSILSIPGQSQGKLQQIKNKYQQLQKLHNKGGPLKFKNVQNWLNNIIQQYCHDEYFDLSLSCAALKKNYIDSNSLMSNGVQPKDVSRIYNSLFVYSIGFNNLIKQISKGNKQLVKNIWKVYSLLVEYCAAGNYQTLVGEIQRDKIRKVEQLKMEIQKRQQIIQKNQQINQGRNISMVRQLKRLKDQNINLANQRQILLQDFQLADQAFTEQVSLRLKFQNTINQIYGVHKQLSNKHGRLYNDFQHKIQQLKKASDKYFQQTKLTQKYKFELIQLKQKHNQLNKINAHDKQHIDVLLIQLEKVKNNYFLTLKQLQQTKYLNIQKQTKLQQIQIELKNNLIILQMRTKSAKQTHTEYQITLQENNKLFKVISQQRTQMQLLLKQKRQFNQNVLKILSDSSYYKKKLQHAQLSVKKLSDKKIELQILVHKFQINTDILNKQIEGYKKDLQCNYENIKKMHKSNFQLQEQLQYLRRFSNNIDKFMQQKNNYIQEFKQKINGLQKDLQEQKKQFMNLESKYKILQTQFRAEQDSNMKKLQQFRKQQQQLNHKQTTQSTLLKSIQSELQRYKQLFKNALTDYKHQKFQRTNLTLNYDQILKIMQNKNGQLKSNSIQINQLQQIVNQYKQKYKLSHLNLMNITDEFNLKINHMQDKIKSFSQIINQRAHHIHPMLYEDVYHRLKKQYQFKQQCKNNLINQKKQAQFNIMQLQTTIITLKNDFQYQNNKLIKQSTQSKQKFISELQYQKQQKQSLKKKLAPLEQLQKTYKQKVYLFQQRQNQQQIQQKLIKQIQNKNNKIKLLYQQLQKIHDFNSNQIKGLQQKVKKTQNQKINFIDQFKIKKQKQLKQQIQKIYQGQMQKMKLQYQLKLKNPKLNKLRQQHSRQASNQEIQIQFKEFIKKKNLDQILLIKKQQIQNSQQSQKSHFISQIQDFFKRQMNVLSLNLFNNTSNQISRRHNSLKNDKIPAYLKKIQNQSQQIKRRTEVSKKLKFTYEYYGKNSTNHK